MVEKRREVSLTEQSWSHVKKDMIGGKPVAHLKLKCLVILRIQSYTVLLRLCWPCAAGQLSSRISVMMPLCRLQIWKQNGENKEPIKEFFRNIWI